jgi:hypothetical protein
MNITPEQIARAESEIADMLDDDISDDEIADHGNEDAAIAHVWEGIKANPDAWLPQYRVRIAAQIQAAVAIERASARPAPEIPPAPHSKSPSQLAAEQRLIAQGEALAAADRVVDVFNEHCAVINIDGKTYILTETEDAEGRDTFELSRKDDALMRWEHMAKVRIVDESGKTRTMHPVKYWLQAGNRRTYRGLGFFATRPPPHDWYNIWRGLAVAPAPGDWSLLREHIRCVICDSDPQLFQWVLAWLADGVRRPGETAHTVLVLVGQEGTGKNKLVDWYGKVFGRHYLMATSERHLLGNFNAHLADAVLIFANESVWAGNKAALGALKSLATDASRIIEPKGINAYSITNMARIIMASNERWVVPAGDDARRFAVLKVSDSHKRDYPYFAAIDKQMESGGLPAMLHELLDLVDVSAINLREPPYTRALLEQKEQTLEGVERFMVEFIRARGGDLLPVPVMPEPPGMNRTPVERWECGPSEIPTKALFASYLEQMSAAEGRARRSLETEFGARVRKLIPGIGPTQKRVIGGIPGVRHLPFPSLPDCRQALANYLHCPVADLFPVGQ